MDDELQESLAHYSKSPQDIIYQQDNDPKHSPRNSSKTMESLFYNGLQSPDLNPIEHLWIHIKRRLREYETPSGMLELWDRVEVEWHKIAPEVCWNLIESIPIRVEGVLTANGGHSKY